VKALHPGDPDYPQALHALPAAPDPLWIDGDLGVLARTCVAIVGTRRMSPYGERVARELAAGLAAGGAVIVSGLAQGIDCAAHASAVATGGSSVAAPSTTMRSTCTRQGEGPAGAGGEWSEGRTESRRGSSRRSSKTIRTFTS